MPQTTAKLRLGPLEIDFPVVQAALSGYSDWPMRAIARRLGAGYTICEVFLDRFVLDVTKGKKAARYVRVADEDHPVGPGRQNRLLEQQLGRICQGLEKPERPHHVGALAQLNGGDDLALGIGQICHGDQQRHQNRQNLRHDDDGR